MEGDFQVGEWLVQPQLGTICLGDKSASLEPKVMDVLVYLARNAGEVLHKERIIQAVWSDTFVGDDVLTHAISELRKAFEDDPHNPAIIQTLPKRGYRLVAPVDLGSSEEAPAWPPTPKTFPESPIPQAAWWAIPVVILIVIGSLWLVGVFQPTVEPLNSVAVLPFDSLSPNPEDDYFSDGITDDIINTISNIRELRVTSRLSSVRYKETEKSPLEIAKELGVSTLLSGTVRRQGGKVRVTAQLIEARADQLLWSETYDRELGDIFTIQSDIAQQVVSALRVELASDEKARIEEEPTRNLEAYDLYLQGRHVREAAIPGFNLKAADLYQRAIALDPNYADAYAGLAEVYFLMQYGGPRSAIEKWGREAAEAARKALELDEGSAEAHYSMGLVRQYPELDWKAAEAAFQRAIELKPQDANAHREYGILLARMGRHDEALAVYLRGHKLDPLSRAIHSHLAQVYLRIGKTDQAIKQSERLIRLYPERFDGYVFLGQAYAQKAMFEEAIEWTEKAVHQHSNSWTKGNLGYLYAAAGQEEKALAMLQEFEDRLPPYWIGLIHSELGHKDTAFEWLEKMSDIRLSHFLNVDWRLAPLRDDPRFHNLLRRVNLEP